MSIPKISNLENSALDFSLTALRRISRLLRRLKVGWEHVWQALKRPRVSGV